MDHRLVAAVNLRCIDQAEIVFYIPFMTDIVQLFRIQAPVNKILQPLAAVKQAFI